MLNHRVRSRSLALLLALAMCAPATRARAASGLSLEGVVLDPSGRAVAAAAVEVGNEGMGQPHAVTADQTGHFSVPELLPGTYTVAVRVPGFDPVTRMVNLADPPTPITVQLSLANVRESVTVS